MMTLLSRLRAWLTFARIRAWLFYADDALALASFGQRLLFWLESHVDPAQLRRAAELLRNMRPGLDDPEDRAAKLLDDLADWIEARRKAGAVVEATKAKGAHDAGS